MYCVYDDEKRIVAFHNEYEVVEAYVLGVKKSYDKSTDLRIGKIKKKKLEKIEDLDDLYLVRYADTYVQSGYLTYLELLSSQSIYDNRQCKDVLLKILELHPITNKERKAIEKTVDVIDRLLQESKEFTPTLKDLQSCEADYAPYLYNKNI